MSVNGVNGSGNGGIYSVKRGDSLWKISRRFNVKFDVLKKANGHINDKSLIMDGDKLNIPGFEVHEVSHSETLSDIANKRDITVGFLRKINNLRDQDSINPGFQLYVPILKEDAKKEDSIPARLSAEKPKDSAAHFKARQAQIVSNSSESDKSEIKWPETFGAFVKKLGKAKLLEFITARGKEGYSGNWRTWNKGFIKDIFGLESSGFDDEKTKTFIQPLQRLLNIQEDGEFGPRTLATLKDRLQKINDAPETTGNLTDGTQPTTEADKNTKSISTVADFKAIKTAEELFVKYDNKKISEFINARKKEGYKKNWMEWNKAFITKVLGVNENKLTEDEIKAVIKHLQELLSIKEDGEFGPGTLAELEKCLSGTLVGKKQKISEEKTILSSNPYTKPNPYVVEEGDTLTSIAANYNVSVAILREINRIEKANSLFSGQELMIPKHDTYFEALLGRDLYSVEECMDFLQGKVRLKQSEKIDINFNKEEQGAEEEKAFRQAVSLAIRGVPYGSVYKEGDYYLDCVSSVREWARSFGVTIDGDRGDKWFDPKVNEKPLSYIGSVSSNNQSNDTTKELLSKIKPGDIVSFGNNNAGYNGINAVHNGIVVSLIKEGDEVVDFVLAHASGSYDENKVSSGKGWAIERGLEYLDSAARSKESPKTDLFVGRLDRQSKVLLAKNLTNSMQESS